MKIYSVRQIAFKDISKYLVDKYGFENIIKGEFIVSCKMLNTPKISLLNKELGLHKINKGKCTK